MFYHRTFRIHPDFLAGKKRNDDKNGTFRIMEKSSLLLFSLQELQPGRYRRNILLRALYQHAQQDKIRTRTFIFCAVTASKL